MVGALSLAEVGLVLLGVDDPVPAVVLLEVDGVVPQAAVRLVHVILLGANLWNEIKFITYLKESIEQFGFYREI